MPRPANADMRCSTVATFAPFASSALHSRVSVTRNASAAMSTGTGRSMRRNTMPVSGAAGRRVIATFSPVCRPTPVARITDFRVRCLNMGAYAVSASDRRSSLKVRHFSTGAPPRPGISGEARTCARRPFLVRASAQVRRHERDGADQDRRGCGTRRHLELDRSAGDDGLAQIAGHAGPFCCAHEVSLVGLLAKERGYVVLVDAVGLQRLDRRSAVLADDGGNLVEHAWVHAAAH